MAASQQEQEAAQGQPKPQTGRKTVVFFPLNSPGHINSSLGLADRLKRDSPQLRIVFLLLGRMIGDSVRAHGHELVILEEARPYEDCELEPDEEEQEEATAATTRKLSEEKSRKLFEGAHKWPQLIMRYRRLFQLEPLEAFVESCKVMEDNMVSELMENHANYEAALRRLEPDLVIIDAYYVPPCVLRLRVPWVRLYSANPMMLVKSRLMDGLRPPPFCGVKLYDKRERERIRREQPDRWSATLDEWRRASAYIFEAMGKAGNELNDFLVAHACEPLGPGQQAHDSPHLNVYMYPRVLDYDQDDDLFEYPARWFRCDSLMREATSARVLHEQAVWARKLEAALGANKLLEGAIYFSLGSLASGDCRLMERYVSMLKHDKRHLYVVSKGVNGHKYELAPDNMIGDNYIPQTLFLTRVRLAIIHGGNNSITECMYDGLPMIVLPVFADQLDNAQRVEDLGYGRRLNVNTCTREQLLATIDEVLADGAMRERARAAGEAMRARDDLAKATGLLNKLLLEGSLDEATIDEAAACE